MKERRYSDEAIARAREGAANWLLEIGDGYPRSWEAEAAGEARRGYAIYEPDFEAPPIAGYESLEADGYAVCVGNSSRNRDRKHYRITEAGRRTLEGQP